MKSEKEIRDEIDASYKTLENYRKAYKSGALSKESLKGLVIDCYATIDTLKWVLGENDRYD